MACAPRPTSSTSSTCHDVWCRNDTGALDAVADLEAEAGHEERLGGLRVGGAHHGVAELAGRNGAGTQDPGRPGAAPLGPARAVVRGGGDGVLVQAAGDLEVSTGAGGLLHRADPVR